LVYCQKIQKNFLKSGKHYFKLKILISPSFLITKKYLTSLFDNFLINFLKIKKSHKIELVNGELNHYGEISKILGSDNVFYLDEIHPIYVKDYCSEYFKNSENYQLIESYPSNFNYEKQNYITLDEVLKKKIKFDFAIFSIKSFNQNFEIVKYLQSINTKVIMFDKLDDPNIYFKGRNFKISENYKYNFDLIFKQDIPLWNNEENVFPIAPIPSIIKNLNERDIKIKNKSNNFYFVGDYRRNITRKDRFDIIEFIKKEFDNYFVNLTTDRKVFLSKQRQDDLLFNTKINISPSGKVWDSYRHCELVNFGSPILIPKPNCKTAPGEFKDMENCIIYETQEINNNFELIDQINLKKKIEIVLRSVETRKKIYENYYNLIVNYHSRYMRSKYIVNTLKKHFKSHEQII